MLRGLICSLFSICTVYAQLIPSSPPLRVTGAEFKRVGIEWYNYLHDDLRGVEFWNTKDQTNEDPNLAVYTDQ